MTAESIVAHEHWQKRLPAALWLAQQGFGIVRVAAPTPDLADCTCGPNSSTRTNGGPCHSPGKHPPGAGWQKYATRDETTIRGHLRSERDQFGAFPEPGSRLVIVDGDKPGIDQPAWPDTFGDYGSLDETSGLLKWHRYYRLPEGVDEASIPAKWAGGEIRVAGNGHCVGPWGQTAKGPEREPFGPRLVAELPVELIEALAPPAPPKQTAGTITVGGLKAYDGGSRHDFLLKRARYYAGTIRDAGILRAVVMAENDKLPIPKTEAEVDRAIGDALKFPADAEKLGGLLLDGAEDDEQADWLATAFEHGVLFDHSKPPGRWHIFDPVTGLWRPDRTTAIINLVTELVRDRVATVALGEHVKDGDRTRALKGYRRLKELSRKESALETLASRPGYGTDGSDLDADPYVLGCANGIVDLRTGSLLAPDPLRRVTRSTGIRYVEMDEPTARARAARFCAFLAEITSEDKDLAEFYLAWFGYSLFGHTRAQKFLIMAGKLGRNGKGALKRIMLHVFGEYGREIDRSLYSANRFGSVSSDRPRADLMQLQGLRLAFLTEPPDRFDTELLKAHTGMDPINARALRSNVQATWIPSHSIVISANHPPEVSDVGFAIRDRILVADFRERFVGSHRDDSLDDKLQRESEAILALLVRYACRWHDAQLARDAGTDAEALPLPKRIVDASAAYMTSNDPTAEFIEHACVLGDKESVPPRDLYHDYLAWHAESESSSTALAEQEFGRIIGGMFEKRGKPATWRGLRPMSSAELAAMPQ